MPDIPNNTLVLTLEQVASLLQLKPLTIRRLVQRKKLRALDGVRHLRITRKSFDRYVEGGGG